MTAPENPRDALDPFLEAVRLVPPSGLADRVIAGSYDPEVARRYEEADVLDVAWRALRLSLGGLVGAALLAALAVAQGPGRSGAASCGGPPGSVAPVPGVQATRTDAPPPASPRTSEDLVATLVAAPARFARDAQSLFPTTEKE